MIHLSQHAEYTALGVNPNLNYGLGVTMVHPCRLISWNKHLMAVRVLLVGAAVHHRGGGCAGKLYLPFCFALDLKLLENQLSLNKNRSTTRYKEEKEIKLIGDHQKARSVTERLNFIEISSLMKSEWKEHWKVSTLESNSNSSGTNTYK